MEKILKENLRSNTENQDKNSISTQNNFRFFDNRQKYLLFVSTCSEKEIISKRVGKEISLEDVRLCLSKMADRLFEHPSTVLVFTNLFYNEAPWLRPKKD